MVIELEARITVYPAQGAGDRWRAAWYKAGRRRQCEAVTEDKLAARLARVTERLQAGAPGLERPGADLIAWYLSPDRHPAAPALRAKVPFAGWPGRMRTMPSARVTVRCC